MIALTDLLKARALTLDAEHRRERVFGARIAMPFRQRASPTPITERENAEHEAVAE
jgi:hypothetical protein